jgi:hypothetical protein
MFPALTPVTHHFAGAATSPTPLDEGIAVIVILVTILVLVKRGGEIKRLPRLVLAGFILPHCLLGWLLGIYNMPWFVWMLAGMGTVVVTAMMTYELGVVGARVLVLAIATTAVALAAGTTVGRVIGAMAIALLLAIAWFGSISQAELHLKRQGFSENQILWILAIAGWEGIALGWMVDTFLIPRFGPWLIDVLTS